MGADNERFVVDVGGWLHTSTLATLRRSTVLSNIIDNAPADGGPPFVDRDGAVFHNVLHYLRNGSVPRIACREYIETLLGEAQFYNIRELEAELTRMLTEYRSDTQLLLLELKAIRLALQQAEGRSTLLH